MTVNPSLANLALSVPVLPRSNTTLSLLNEPKRSNTLPPRGSRELKEASRECQEGPRGLATGFKRLQELSTCLQERSKSHFGPLQELPGPEKSMKSFVLCATFVILSFSARVAFGARCGTLLGSILDAFWPLRSAMLAPSWLPESSKSAPRGLKRAPGGFPEAPRGSKKRSKRPLRDPQAAKTAPRALQEAPGSIFEPFGDRFWSHFGAILRAKNRAEGRAESRAKSRQIRRWPLAKQTMSSYPLPPPPPSARRFPAFPPPSPPTMTDDFQPSPPPSPPSLPDDDRR